MKARIKKTGEVVNLASYAKIALDEHDSWGNPIELKPEEVELIQEQTKDEHWQDVRERAAIAAMGQLIGMGRDDGYKYSPLEVANYAVMYADALVEQLKKK